MADAPNNPPQNIPPSPNPPFQPMAVPQAAPPYQPVAVPQPRQGSSAVKIILIILAILVGMGMLGAAVVGYGIYKVAHAVKRAADGQVSVNVPGGFSANTSQSVSSSDLGIAIYPGATQGKGGLHMTIAGKTMVSANFFTSDSVDQVVAFYKDKAGANAQVMTTGNGGIISVTHGSDAISITVSQNTSSNNGQTQFVVIHTTGAASSN
jgi:hypothetical protein